MRYPFDFLTNCAFKENFRLKSAILGFLGLFFFSSTALAGNTDSLGFKTRLSNPNPKEGDTIEIIFTANIPAHFHVYSEKSDCPADDGPMRAEFTYDAADAFTLIGNTYGVGDKMVKEDEVWHCSTGEFTGTCEFRQKIKVLGGTYSIMAHFTGQKCSDSDGMCFKITENIALPRIVISESDKSKK